VLDDLVCCILCSAADNKSVTATENGDGIFTDIAEPDVGQSARAYRC